jgi:hypothetical protein
MNRLLGRIRDGTSAAQRAGIAAVVLFGWLAFGWYLARR